MNALLWLTRLLVAGPVQSLAFFGAEQDEE